MQLTEKELLILQDTDFLLTKATVLEKINTLLRQTREELKGCVENSNFSFPDGTDLLNGKISKGENYKNLPYMVLDYPALFTTKTVFAYRTMFWWGNFFSATLHLEGIALNYYRNSITINLNKLLEKDVYIGVGDTPWQYHYEKDNYIPLTENHKYFINNCKFLKLSKKLELKKWNDVPEFSTNFFELILPVLKLRK
ncbi:MAG: hypothetical protein IIA49_06905 [Bacteroidetes bacterium]|nr:hypothetical protein [Bacteroidota bacterium]MCH7770731.1 hypothetical protein [Bacteroidota bacterium]